MRKNLGAKEFTYPQPVYMVATYDADGVPNVMTAAWGCISDYKEIFLAIDHSHKTADNLLISGAFTVSIATQKYIKSCDYVGLISSHKEPAKLAKAGFTTVKSELVNAPIICELPMTLECRVKSYDSATDKLFGEIVNISADESIFNAAGNIDPAKLQPVIFDPCNHTYLAVGNEVAKAFSCGLELK